MGKRPKRPKRTADPTKRHTRSSECLTPDTMHDYAWQHCAANVNDNRLRGYADANYAVSQEIGRIIKTASDFEELKNELVNFQKARKEFQQFYQSRMHYFDRWEGSEVAWVPTSDPVP